MTQEKRCTKCNQWKPATTEFFSTNKYGKFGLRSHCRKCEQQMNATNLNRLVRRREYGRLYARLNPDKARASVNRRRARKLAAGGTFSREDVQRKYDAQQGRCYWCGAAVGDNYHVDHFIPLSRGGTNYPDNIVIACPTCNMSRGAKLPHEWNGPYKQASNTVIE